MAKFDVGDIVEIGRSGGEWGRIKALVSDDDVIPRYEIEIGDKASIYPEYMLTPVAIKGHKFCFPMTVSILGTKYSVVLVDKFDDDESNFAGGFTDPDLHIIKIRDLEKMDEWKKETPEKIEARQKEILRHEIVHAYLDESGLKWCTIGTGDSWSRNEISIHAPRVGSDSRLLNCARVV